MPPRKVELCERAPNIEPMKQMRAANPQPIQKMEGIKSAPYRTDNGEGIHDRSRKLLGNERNRPRKTRN